jgi:hypothetical protein
MTTRLPASQSFCDGTHVSVNLKANKALPAAFVLLPGVRCHRQDLVRNIVPCPAPPPTL